MMHFRALIRQKRRFSMFLLVAALCLKIWVPAGYMIGSSSKWLAVEICADGGAVKKQMLIAVPMHDNSHKKQSDAGKSQGVCAFASLSMLALGGADELLCALALTFILAQGLGAVGANPRVQLSFLWPFLRGPPLII